MLVKRGECNYIEIHSKKKSARFIPWTLALRVASDGVVSCSLHQAAGGDVVIRPAQCTLKVAI